MSEQSSARDRGTIRVVIADDQPLVRAGFRMILESEDGIEIVGEAENGREAVDIARRTRPDVVLIDVRMPVLDGIEATRLLTAPGFPSDDALPLRVLVMTTFDLDEYVYASLRAGASGFLLKDTPADDLVAAVRTVAHGDAVVSPSVTRRLIDRFTEVMPDPSADRSEMLATLTDREHEVLALIARGRSNAEIAAELFVAETTVKTHVGRVLTKLGLRDRVQAVVLAYETGLVRPGDGR